MSTSPLRQQYLAIKRRYPGMLLLFQIGDFYETFDEDAQLLSRELGVALTRKWFGKNDVRPLAGIPVRALEFHLAKLIQRGHKLAICDQLTPPGKGLVEREVVRVITPGTVIEPGLLPGRDNSFLASLVAGERCGLAYADVSTGEFRATELPPEETVAELSRLQPAELLAPAGLMLQPAELRGLCPVTHIPDDQAEPEAARRALCDHFSATTLFAFGLEGRPQALRAAGALVAYLRDTQPDALANLTQLSTYHTDRFMQLDPQALRDLEVFPEGPRGWAQDGGSLLQRLDQTCTPMGGRLLRRHLRQPLLSVPELRARLDAVEWFVRRGEARAGLRGALCAVPDVERLLARVRRRLAAPAEVIALAQGLAEAARARAELERAGAPADFTAALVPTDDLRDLVHRALGDGSEREAGIIRPGFSPELDQLRQTLRDGNRYLAELEERERQRTGIRSLKVGYNKVFGYYIEVTRPNLQLVPQDYLRKQTLSAAERFYTAELKEKEALLANTRERIAELEQSLFRLVCEEIGNHRERIAQIAAGLARLDLSAALAECAAGFGYVRPEVVDQEHGGADLHIVAGRHPVLEATLGPGQAFVPNDTGLDPEGAQIMLITAPNMAGKSVYLRQVGLICLMGQIGSFVPAQGARLPILDRIFTRVAKSDATQPGRSTFLAEMAEVAHILHHATEKSLIILDEVGRGTSTADGLAIARAVVEYLHNHPRLRGKTLFATHFHELTACADYLPRVRNFHIRVRETDDTVEYLHEVTPGKAERSFGLHVAGMAGMPRPVLRRAAELLGEGGGGSGKGRAGDSLTPGPSPIGRGGTDLDALIGALAGLDVPSLSPIEALTRLYELSERARDLLKR